MFADLLGGLVSDEEKAQMAVEKIEDKLEAIAKELSEKEGKTYTHDDFIIAIKPMNGEFNFKCFILKATTEFAKAIPETIVREITLKEILK